jgi:hypothetical protein
MELVSYSVNRAIWCMFIGAWVETRATWLLTGELSGVSWWYLAGAAFFYLIVLDIRFEAFQ